VSTFLNTLGKSNLAVAICDRCKLRLANADMVEDRDKPGLWVHPHCADDIDPWKLPPRRTEDTTVPHPRPDSFVGSASPPLIPGDTP
jgi:hypothetical protein